MATKVIRVSPSGEVRAIYDDSLAPLLQKGKASIARASYVEPDPEDPTSWMVDLSASGGPVKKGFTTREEALKWEVDWLNENRLGEAAKKI